MEEKLPIISGTATTEDQTALAWEAMYAQSPKGVVLMLHGYNDHQGRYHAVRELLASSGFSVWSFDFRGHGRSSGKRSHVDRFEDYLEDLRTIRSLMDEDESSKGLPCFLLGHSMGGCIALMHSMRYSQGLSGVIVSSPMLRLRLAVPIVKVLLAKALSRALPAFSMPSGLRGEDLSHDPEAIRLWQVDPLVGRAATARWFTESRDAMSWVNAMAPSLKVPILMLVAGADPVVAPDAARSFFERVTVQNREFKEYPGYFHEILFEAERERVHEDLLSWLNRSLA